ncbi:MAG: FAD-binding protein [Candidatus Eisenbacteria bacterium]|nr:FAD-binding protein [Candidatus Latescibacterota bacterium]MBD3301677.1 FAD-binding protein [Candidatus Eisenbacteria bacterium]
MEADLVIVGAGPAGLACAMRLAQIKEEGKLADATILLLEKASYVGAHAISGAVIDPRGLEELFGDFLAHGCPVEGPVAGDDLYFLTEGGKLRFPFLPPMLKNHGNYVASLHKVTKWMAEKVEEAGIDVLPGFPGQELLYEGDRVVGVRTGDRGLDKEGEPKASYEPGVDIRAPIVILAEGARGSLTKELVNRLGLDAGRNPQIYATGVKEVWEVPEERLPVGGVIHTLGWPLASEQYGGGFVYGMRDRALSLGFVVALDARNPFNDPHGLTQDWKRHPLLRGLLDGGKLLNYGAKTIPEGGYFSVPRPATDGCLLIGDTAGFLNAARLKGIHLGIKTGMLAAETAAEALEADDPSGERLGRYEQRVEESWVGAELRSVRNFRQGFSGGLWKGMIHTGLVLATGGRGLKEKLPLQPDHTHMMKLEELRAAGRPAAPPERAFDGKLTFDKLTEVYASETTHEENQPSHLHVADTSICATRCREEYGNPCQHFCPASVYEMVPDEGTGGIRLQVNFTNCVHCKTCDIMDPYEIITWVPPEGGGGPNYVNL